MISEFIENALLQKHCQKIFLTLQNRGIDGGGCPSVRKATKHILLKFEHGYEKFTPRT